MKQLAIVLLVVLTSACTHERSNRTLTKYGTYQPELKEIGEQSTEASAEISLESPSMASTNDAVEQRVEATADISLETIEKRKQVADLAKKNHGLMHIHRYGPGFDILMTLDTGDSDVSFSMKLPKTAGAMEASSEGDLQKTAEEIAEKNKQVLASLNDEKAEAHHEEFEQRNDLVEQKKIQDFKASTKHIFSAQSLFYKKQYWQSLDETNKALELVPDSAQAHALKGSIYFKMGLTPEAKASWQQALEIDPNMEQVKSSLARLR